MTQTMKFREMATERPDELLRILNDGSIQEIRLAQASEAAAFLADFQPAIKRLEDLAGNSQSAIIREGAIMGLRGCMSRLDDEEADKMLPIFRRLAEQEKDPNVKLVAQEAL